MTRRILLAATFLAVAALPALAADTRLDITTTGALPDGTTLNTQAIQKAIDQLAEKGGGTLLIPKGTFLTGALFLKPAVNLELAEGAILLGSKNIEDFPIRPNTRFEGHFADWRAGLLNAEKTDNLKISGPGTIDGNGATYWTMKTPQGRPRLCVIRDSKNVTVTGGQFSTSPSWNLHLYNCSDVTVDNCRFTIPNDGKGPSTDGIDIDSSQNVTVKSCYFSVNDDCVCLKGNRYDGLDQEPKSPPVQNVKISDCTFARGMGALTLGTEAQLIQNVEFSNSVVTGRMPMLRLKMRPDTSNQHFKNVSVHDIKLDGLGTVLSWEPTHGTKTKAPPPLGIIENISVSNITGSFGSFGKIAGNDNSEVKNISLKNITLTLKDPNLNTARTTNLTTENITINDQPFTPSP